MFHVEPVTRTRSKLRIALTGVSHSGKTLSALKLAAGMGFNNIVVIDTEEPGCTAYQDQVSAPYQMIKFKPPFTAERYVEAIHVAEQTGADIIVIDSFTHAWAGSGGLLEKQSAITEQSKSGNSYIAWAQITPLHNKLIDAILQSSAHVIVCMRAKSHMEIMDINGKKVPVKLGLEPIQRKDIEYEFTVAFKLEHGTNLYTIDKDVTGIFKNRSEQITEQTGKELVAWMLEGKEPINPVNIVNEWFGQTQNLLELKDAFTKAIAQFGNQVFITEAKDKRKGELTNAESIPSS